MNDYEDVCIFSEKQTVYNPQGVKPQTKPQNEVYGKFNSSYMTTGTNYPRRIIRFKRDSNKEHPAQKPLFLYEYLIRTYTNPGETVLDLTMGNGTTGVAAIQTGRRFIGIEKDAAYFAVAGRRIANAQPPLFI